MIFDLENPYVKSLIGDPHYNRYKLILTREEWSNWTLPDSDRPRVFVRIGPFNVTGRGYDRDAGWNVLVCGSDDCELSLSLRGPNMEDLALSIYNMIDDFTTKDTLRGLSFR